MAIAVVLLLRSINMLSARSSLIGENSDLRLTSKASRNKLVQPALCWTQPRLLRVDEISRHNETSSNLSQRRCCLRQRCNAGEPETNDKALTAGRHGFELRGRCSRIKELREVRRAKSTHLRGDCRCSLAERALACAAGPEPVDLPLKPSWQRPSLGRSKDAFAEALPSLQ